MLIVPNSHPKGQIRLRLVDGRMEFNLSLETLFCVSFFFNENWRCTCNKTSPNVIEFE